MIKIFFKENGNVEVLGHANYDEYGKDIVCSAVSSIVQFVANILSREKKATVTKSNGKLKIIMKKEDEFTTKLIDYMKEAIKSLENDYPDHIKLEVNEK